MEGNLNLNAMETEEKPLGFFQKLIGIFVNPKEVIEDILSYPKMLLPLIYTSILIIAVYYIRLPLVPITNQKMADIYLQYGMDLSQQLEQNNTLYYISGLFGPLSLLMIWGIGGIFLWLIAKIFGDKSSIKQIYSLYAHAFMIIETGALIAAPLGLLLKTDIVIFSPAAFMPNGNAASFLYNFLSMFEFFTIWGMLFAGLGISLFNQFSKLKGMIIAFLHLLLGNAFIAFTATLQFLMLNLVNKNI
ncbi:MAG: hypothetical protein GX308_02750 [Epulopiscium sp.]|nr:hypothetical protein [Candidatus Epulonipiscium sp.]